MDGRVLEKKNQIFCRYQLIKRLLNNFSEVGILENDANFWSCKYIWFKEIKLCDRQNSTLKYSNFTKITFTVKHTINTVIKYTDILCENMLVR